MGLRVNAAQAAALCGRSERRVREWIRTGKLKAAPSGPRAKGERTGPSAWSIDTDDLAALPGVGTISRDRLAELEASSGSRSPGGVLARLEQMEARIRSLEARLRMLEGQNAPVTRSEAQEGASMGETVSAYVPAPLRAPGARPGASLSSSGWPSSARGRSKWIESHGGPGASWVREWPDILTWAGPDDAIAAVRSRARGYEHWQPDVSG